MSQITNVVGHLVNKAISIFIMINAFRKVRTSAMLATTSKSGRHFPETFDTEDSLKKQMLSTKFGQKEKEST